MKCLNENIKQNRNLSKEMRARRRDVERRKNEDINQQMKIMGKDPVNLFEDETKYGRKEPNPTVDDIKHFKDEIVKQ